MKNINAIRTLSIDMVQKANSGHPGIAMGAAPMMESLFANEMKISAKNSKWFNRDRFILSAGHGSAMLYATLHLSGYKISMDDLKQFRQLNSLTPGHPEVGHTDGVDSTSGPLGQGIAQGVGFAIAQAHLGAKYNKEGLNIIDHYTYILCGDGDLQEGVASEASSLAGHLKLNKLILLWDSNDVQLDDLTNKATSENIRARYEAYGWNTMLVEDGNTNENILKALKDAKKSDKPTLIEVKTIIGYGSDNAGGTSACHGAPLGKEEVKLVKKNYKWDLEPFTISEDIYNHFQNNTITNGDQEYNKWLDQLEKYKNKFPKEYEEFINILNNKEFKINNLEFELDHSEASRVSSFKAINNINEQIPNLIGGSADLSKSNNSNITNSKTFGVDGYENKNIAFGVREFAMASITNGMSLHGGLKTYCATFFVFSDYLKPALRMSAIQNLPNIYVLTHDSIAVGEDGPTHEPIEQLTGLRAIPNVIVIRPCDANETQLAWESAINSKDNPTVLVLSRQNLKVITKTENIKDNFSRGAYVIYGDSSAQKVLIASGSEVALAIEVAKKLEQEDNIKTKVISMPSLNLFKKQSKEYKKEVLGDLCKKHRYFIEMATAYEGYEFANNLINITKFGKSAPGDEVMKDYGFSVDDIYSQIKKDSIN